MSQTVLQFLNKKVRALLTKVITQTSMYKLMYQRLAILLMVLYCFNANSQARYYITSSSGQPWSSQSNINSMNAVFGLNNWIQGSFQNINVAAMLQPTTCFIFLEGGDFNANALN